MQSFNDRPEGLAEHYKDSENEEKYTDFVWETMGKPRNRVPVKPCEEQLLRLKFEIALIEVRFGRK